MYVKTLLNLLAVVSGSLPPLSEESLLSVLYRCCRVSQPYPLPLAVSCSYRRPCQLLSWQNLWRRRLISYPVTKQ